MLKDRSSSGLPYREPLYREVQRFRQPWLLAIIVGAAAVCWWIFVEQIGLGRPVGNHPGPDWLVWLVWLVFGVAMPWFFLQTSLLTEVNEEEIVLRLFSPVRRRIPLAAVETVEVRLYSPLREYGGWGVRGWGKNVAYNVSGNRGVQLTLSDGRRVMLGSQRPEELAVAIETQRCRGPADTLP